MQRNRSLITLLNFLLLTCYVNKSPVNNYRIHNGVFPHYVEAGCALSCSLLNLWRFIIRATPVSVAREFYLFCGYQGLCLKTAQNERKEQLL